jgi:RNA polymerase sigma-70 factor (ECF subfamily)
MMGTVALELAPDSPLSYPSQPIWSDQVRQVARGDRDALAALYDGTSRLVYSLALRILGDSHDAEEVTLDVYTQVWRSAKSFDSGRGTVEQWLVMMTRSRAIDRVRSLAQQRRREIAIDTMGAVLEADDCPEQESALNQQRRLVRAAVKALPLEQRQAIELAFYGGLSHTELAAALGQPLGTVKTRIRLGMLKLRERLCALAQPSARPA